MLSEAGFERACQITHPVLSRRAACSSYPSETSETSPRSTQETAETVKRCAKYFEALGCPVKEDRPPRLAEASEITRKLGSGDGNAWIKRLTIRNKTKTPSPGRRFDQPQIPTPEFTEAMAALDA